jgi:hypothetical protein
MTKLELISDVILQLTQSSPSDDLALDSRQIAEWLTYHANLIIATEINSKLALSEMIPSIYQTHEMCRVLELEDVECGGDCEDRVKLTVTYPVMTLNNDGGVIMLQTYDGQQILKAGDISKLMLLRQMRFAKPSDDNFVYYRQGQTFYIEGIPSNDLDGFDCHVTYVRQYDYSTAADSDQVVASELVLPIIIDRLVSHGKLELYGTQVDETSDGVDPKKLVYHQAVKNTEE